MSFDSIEAKMALLEIVSNMDLIWLSELDEQIEGEIERLALVRQKHRDILQSQDYERCPKFVYVPKMSKEVQ